MKLWEKRETVGWSRAVLVFSIVVFAFVAVFAVLFEYRPGGNGDIPETGYGKESEEEHDGFLDAEEFPDEAGSGSGTEDVSGS